MVEPMTMIALASLLYSAYSDYNQETGDKSTYTGNQQSLIDQSTNAAMGNGGMPDITQNQQYMQGNDWLNSLFNDPEFFNQFEAPMMRNFEEQIMPGLTNKYAAMGTGGAFQGSSFRNQAVREGGNLQEKLAQLRGGMQQQGVNQAFQSAQMPNTNWQNLTNSALGHQPNNVYQPPASSTGNILGPILEMYLKQQSNNQTNSTNSPAKPEVTPGINPNTQAGTWV